MPGERALCYEGRINIAEPAAGLMGILPSITAMAAGMPCWRQQLPPSRQPHSQALSHSFICCCPPFPSGPAGDHSQALSRYCCLAAATLVPPPPQAGAVPARQRGVPGAAPLRLHTLWPGAAEVCRLQVSERWKFASLCVTASCCQEQGPLQGRLRRALGEQCNRRALPALLSWHGDWT